MWVCTRACSSLCVVVGESLCAGKPLVAYRAHISKINHVFRLRFAIYKFPLFLAHAILIFWEAGNVNIFIRKMRKLRLRGVRWLA